LNVSLKFKNVLKIDSVMPHIFISGLNKRQLLKTKPDIKTKVKVEKRSIAHSKFIKTSLKNVW